MIKYALPEEKMSLSLITSINCARHYRLYKATRLSTNKCKLKTPSERKIKRKTRRKEKSDSNEKVKINKAAHSLCLIDDVHM